jgi:hypothetical protein
MLSSMFTFMPVWQHRRCLIYQLIITGVITALRWLGSAPAVPKVFGSPPCKPHTTRKRPMRRLVRRLQATERPITFVSIVAAALLLVLGIAVPSFRSHAAGAVAFMQLPRSAGCAANDNGYLPSNCSGETGMHQVGASRCTLAS